MIKYPSIGQFRNAVKSVQLNAQYVGRDQNDDPVYDESKPLPVLQYRGSVKIHGTNSSVVFGEDIFCQSRNNRITPENDNAGFARFMNGNRISALYDWVTENFDCGGETVVVYGEWCGPGIQKGVAVNELAEKHFVIFDVLIGDVWQFKTIENLPTTTVNVEDPNIHLIHHFTNYYVFVDFNDPVKSTNALENLTNEVERTCPFSKAFGVDGIGEGIVWKCITEGYENNPKFWFKTKGEKHKVSKTKQAVPVDVEKMESINDLVGSLVTDQRLWQGMEGMEFDRKNIGKLLKWMNEDIQKEESDTIAENGFTFKDIQKAVSEKTKNWFFSNELV